MGPSVVVFVFDSLIDLDQIVFAYHALMRLGKIKASLQGFARSARHEPFIVIRDPGFCARPAAAPTIKAPHQEEREIFPGSERQTAART